MKNSQSKQHWDAAHYNRHASLQYKQAMELIESYPFCCDEKILDLGCGDGNVSHQIALRVKKGAVLAVDQSRDMVDFADKAHGNIKNLRFTVGDAQHLNFNDEFDLVTSFCCLHWTKNKSTVFSGIYNALKINGKALLTMALITPEFDQSIKEICALPEWSHYFVNYIDPVTPLYDDAYDSYAKAAGFNVEKQFVCTRKEVFDDYESLFNWMKALTPHCIQLSNKKNKERFMHSIVKKYLSKIDALKENYYINVRFVELVICK